MNTDTQTEPIECEALATSPFSRDGQTQYTDIALRNEAKYLRSQVRKSARAQGFEPQFIGGYVLTLRSNENACLSVYYTMNGLLQCSNCAI